MSSRRDGAYQWLAGYVLNVVPEHRLADPARWTRLNAYTLNSERTGEKVAWERVTNCQCDDRGWAVKEIVVTQARNRRSGADKSYHLVVSFPAGELPTRAQVEDIEDWLCTALGLQEHQRVSAVHQNTDNWHVHVVINKVHPRTFHIPRLCWDHYRLQAACVELEIRHGLRREPHTTGPQRWGDNRKIKGRRADFEAWQGRPSFLRWVREMAAPTLLGVRDGGQGWPELHNAAARFDLEIKPHGAGLIIAHRSVARLCLKASDVDRRLSFKAVTDALGPFQPPGQATGATPTVSYATPAPSGSLYEAFTQARIAAIAARSVTPAKPHEQHLEDEMQPDAYDGNRVRAEPLAKVSGQLKRDAFQHIDDQQRRNRGETMPPKLFDRRQVRAQHRILTWQSYLETEASNGNEAALAALRDRALHRAQTDGLRLQAEDGGDARHIVRVHLRPTVRRDGRVIYRTTDGGVVWDEARSICIEEVTAEAVCLALSLASTRFSQRPLRVNGSDDFRAQVAELAGIKGFKVTFSDDALEKQRGLAERSYKSGVERDHAHAHSAHDTSAIAAWRGHGR